ncbi:MAG: hypothetical protein R6W97_08080 [Thiobacillus sp.]
MKNRPAVQGHIQRKAGFRQDGREDRMGVAMMSVLVVLLIIRAARSVVIRVTAFVMIMVMRMKARSGHIFPHVSMQARRRGPGELERNDEHDDQGDEATHEVYSTELIVSTKGSLNTQFDSSQRHNLCDELELLSRLVKVAVPRCEMDAW